jgi:hypothetical protein
LRILPGWNVREVSETNLRVLIPTEHGVDGLGKFCTALLANATSVDLNVLQIVLKGFVAASFNFGNPAFFI